MIRFISVSVREAPGFDGPYRPELRDLGPGLNLVLAPNAAGKSTLARAMRGLLWPKSEKGVPDVEALLGVGEGTVRVRQTKGMALAEPFSPDCAPAAYHDFRLSDLLQSGGDTEKEMAKSAERAMKGYVQETVGKPFEANADSLRTLGGPRTRIPRIAQEEYRRAYEEREGAKARSKETNDLDRRLEEEKAILAALTPADELALEGAMLHAYLEAREKVGETLGTLRGFDRRAALFLPGDLTRRQRLVEELRGSEESVRERADEVANHRRLRGDRHGRILAREEESELTGRVAQAGEAWRAWQEALRDLNLERARTGRTVASAMGLAGVPEGFDPLTTAKSLSGALGELEVQAERWGRVEARAKAFESLQGGRPSLPPESMASDETPAPPSSEVRERILARWENVRPAESSLCVLPLGIGALAAVGAAFLPSPLSLLCAGLSVAAAIAVFILTRTKATSTGEDTGELREAIRAEIEAWKGFHQTAGRIESGIEREKWRTGVAAAYTAWWQGVEREYADDLAAAGRVLDERNALVRSLGFPDGTSDLTLTLAHRIVQTLATTETDLAEKETLEADARSRYGEAWCAARGTLDRLSEPPPSGRGHGEGEQEEPSARRPHPPMGEGVLGDLHREANALSELSRLEENLRASEESLRKEEVDRDRLRQEIETLDAERKTLDGDEFAALAKMSDQRRNALSELRAHWRNHGEKVRALATRGLLARMRTEDGFRLELLRLAASDSEAKAKERREEIERRQGRVRDFEATLREARATNALEERDASLSLTREELARTREAVAEAAAGREMLAWLDETVRRTDLPPVLNAANDLLDRAVPGLSLGAKDGELVAYEGDQPKRLSQLSDGTRVQAILAARLGFLKHQEEGRTRAPLFLDETLANSDVERAESVMRMILELCREGRQVFYFSNQAGEAARWRDVAQEIGPDLFRVHPLDVPGRPRLRVPDKAGEPEYLAGLPDPADGFAAYLEALMIAPCDPWAESLDSLPLAWLCAPDELELLHEAMGNRRDTYGKLMARPGSYPPAWIAKVRARAAFLEELRRVWCEGRSKPWKRADLEEGFGRKGLREEGKQTISAVLEEVGGDPRRLYARLRLSRQIKGWGSEPTAEFLFWLESKLPVGKPNSREEASETARTSARRHFSPSGPLSNEDAAFIEALLLW
ncbi:AAA family ATPase [soil metagenome]